MRCSISIIRLFCLLLLLQSTICSTAHCQSQNLALVLNALPKVMGGLTGFKITALETNVDIDKGKFARDILQSNIKTNFNEAQVAMLENQSHAGPKTNTVHYIYKFGNGVIYISREQFDALGKLTQRETVFVTADEIREYHNPVEADGVPGEGYVGRAEIRNREINGLVGLPVFLSKSVLHDWIENSSVKSCETGKASTGQDCYIITLSGTPHSPIQKYKVFFSLDTYSPVEYDSYLTNGAIFAHTYLQFDEPGKVPFVCMKAIGQAFSSGKVSRQYVWVVQNIEEDKTPLSENAETFIPPKTQVWDQRFSKPLNYHMGAHPPTPDQINLMLTDSNGVASYESGIFIQAGTNKISSERRNWIRGIFIILIISPLLIFLPKSLKKR